MMVFIERTGTVATNEGKGIVEVMANIDTANLPGDTRIRHRRCCHSMPVRISLEKRIDAGGLT